jgi:hypothetical protein
MSTLRHYTSDQFALAAERYKSVVKKNTKEFMEWLGFHGRYLEQYGITFGYVPFSCGQDTSAYLKMEMLLNPHWHALLKVYLIQNEPPHSPSDSTAAEVT